MAVWKTVLLLVACCLVSQVLGQQCSQGYAIVDRGVTDADKELILNLHNQYRNQVADGRVTTEDGALPSASNMKKLKWNLELAAAAQEQTDRCIFENFFPNTASFGKDYGQNIFQFTSSSPSFSSGWQQVLDSWWNKKNSFSVQNVKPYQFDSDAGLFAQMVWGTTEMIGCGKTSYSSSEDGYLFNTTFYSCDYAPAGNVVSLDMDSPSSVYEPGTPCTSCTCDQEYPKLCN